MLRSQAISTERLSQLIISNACLRCIPSGGLEQADHELVVQCGAADEDEEAEELEGVEALPTEEEGDSPDEESAAGVDGEPGDAGE